MTLEDFERDVAEASRCARERPLVITDEGGPSRVLMSYEEYQRLRGKRSLAEALGSHRPATWRGEDIELDVERPRTPPSVPDLSE